MFDRDSEGPYSSGHLIDSQCQGRWTQRYVTPDSWRSVVKEDEGGLDDTSAVNHHHLNDPNDPNDSNGARLSSSGHLEQLGSALLSRSKVRKV